MRVEVASRDDSIKFSIDELTDDETKQFKVMMDAFALFLERNKRHKSIWMESGGWRGCLFDIRKKIDRLWGEFFLSEEPPGDYDSAIDAINFLAFFIIGHRDGIEGNWPWN